MLNREACERRVYRLATLLTGNPIAAARVIAAVVDAQPNLGKLDSAHLDRLTVLRSREIAPGTIVDGGLPPPVASAVSALPAQQREAWVLTHVYRVPFRETARAMDCSVIATTRHLQQAEGALASAGGASQQAAAQKLLSYSMSLDVPAFYRARRKRRQRIRRVRLAIIVAVVLGATVLAVMWLTQEFAGV